MSKYSTTENGVPGPTFLEAYTEHIRNPKKLLEHEWRRKLKSPAGHNFFRIKYYGKIHQHYTTLITGTSFAPALIYAVDPEGTEILLFDGCRHGYNAMLCDEYSRDRITQRPVNSFYKDEHGNEVFEITISTYNSINFDEELASEMDANGNIELLDGSMVPFDTLKRNGFDTIQIFATTYSGVTFEMVSEELA